MSLMYAIFLIFGIFVLVNQIVKVRKIKKINSLFEQSFEEENVYKQKDKTRQLLEKSDAFLLNIRLFDENITLKILCVFGIFIFVYLLSEIFSLNIARSTLGLVGVVSLLLFFLVPSYLQKFIIESRIQKIGRDIPMFVDLMAICVQSGMNIEGAVKFLEGSISQVNKGFAPFLNRIVLKSEVSGLEAAIDDLQKELPSTEISMMCTTLKQSLKYGSAVYETLMNLSMEIRELELLKTEEAIGKLSAKMSIPLILFFMFPVIIIIAAPGVMKVLEGF